MHFISVGTDTSLHYLINFNSNPLAVRAASFKWDAQHEHHVRLFLLGPTLLHARNLKHQKNAAKNVFSVAFG